MGNCPSESVPPLFTLEGDGEPNATFYTIWGGGRKCYFTVPLRVEPHQQEALEELNERLLLLEELNTPPHPRVHVPMHTHENPFSLTEETPLVEWWIESTRTGLLYHDYTYKWVRSDAHFAVDAAKVNWRNEVEQPIMIEKSLVRIRKH
jgi:hypothetical protein